MESTTQYLCARCARRLGRYESPGVPELLEGYCPQCGGTEPLLPIEAAAPLSILQVSEPSKTNLAA